MRLPARRAREPVERAGLVGLGRTLLSSQRVGPVERSASYWATIRTGRWGVITRSRHRRARLLAGAALSLTACFVAQPLSSVIAATPAATGQAGTDQPSQKVMLVLRHTCLPDTRTSPGAACPAQARVLGALKAGGAKVLATTSLVDSITASVSPALAHALRLSPAISEVIPDTPLSATAPNGPSSGTTAPGPGSPAPAAATPAPAATTPPVLRAHGVAPPASSVAPAPTPNWAPKPSRSSTPHRRRRLEPTGLG